MQSLRSEICNGRCRKQPWAPAQKHLKARINGRNGLDSLNRLWEAGLRFLHRRSETCEGIGIRGGVEFLRETREALILLKSTTRFAEIHSHLDLIAEGRRSGMKAWAKTFVVGAPTWRHSTLWYAGAVAHDAYHAKLYLAAKQATPGREPDPDCWTGPMAEKQCLDFQLQVLNELDADPKTKAYLQKCRANPTYQGRHRGWRSWLDYLKRGW